MASDVVREYVRRLEAREARIRLALAPYAALTHLLVCIEEAATLADAFRVAEEIAR